MAIDQAFVDAMAEAEGRRRGGGVRGGGGAWRAWREGGGGPVMERRRVWVLMGGDTSERQVSVMSGTNAWLQLRRVATMQVRGGGLRLCCEL